MCASETQILSFVLYFVIIDLNSPRLLAIHISVERRQTSSGWTLLGLPTLSSLCAQVYWYNYDNSLC